MEQILIQEHDRGYGQGSNKMRQFQENGKDVPLLKIWCAVHRSALAWTSVCSSVAEVNYLIRDAAALATYFHSSGVRTRELHKVATENNLKVLRLPQYFEVRWSQYTSQILRSIPTSIRAILMYLKTSPDADANGYLKNWLKKDRLHLSCFFDGCCHVILKIPNEASKRQRFSI